MVLWAGRLPNETIESFDIHRNGLYVLDYHLKCLLVEFAIA